MKSVVLYVSPQHYVLNFSLRKIDGLKIIQKDLWNQKIPKIAMKIFRRLDVLGAKIVSNISEDRGKYDVAIYPEWEMTPQLLNYIIKHPIAKKQVIFFANAVNKKTEYILKKSRRSNICLYTYNSADSRNYQMKYCRQCWNKDLVGLENKESESDIFFVGLAKTRYSDIVKIKCLCENKGLKTDFVIVSKNDEPYTSHERLPYTECIERVKRSKAVLDIVGDGNIGLTYRPLEALFLKRKLVTNYSEIQEYDFYNDNRENIFVLGVDDLNGISEFVREPFKENKFDMMKYDIESWIQSLVE